MTYEDMRELLGAEMAMQILCLLEDEIYHDERRRVMLSTPKGRFAGVCEKFRAAGYYGLPQTAEQ